MDKDWPWLPTPCAAPPRLDDVDDAVELDLVVAAPGPALTDAGCPGM
jgi:hypothetical protein